MAAKNLGSIVLLWFRDLVNSYKMHEHLTFRRKVGRGYQHIAPVHMAGKNRAGLQDMGRWLVNDMIPHFRFGMAMATG